MILNYLDEVLDNILNNTYTFIAKTKISLQKYQDIKSIITELNDKIQIDSLINKILIDNKITLENNNQLRRLSQIYHRYMYIYMFIFVGINLYEKNEQEFINLVIFSYNNYLESFMTPKTNSSVIKLRKICIQILPF